MRTVLIEASPWNPATGVVSPVYLAGGGEVAYTHRGRSTWLAGVIAEPKFSSQIQFDENGFAGGARPEFGVITFAPGKPETLDQLANLLWIGAAVEVLVGDDRVGAWATLIKGTAESVTAIGGKLVLRLRDISGALDVPVASDRFAGTGGIEGDAFVAGRTKRRSWGYASNVEALPLKQSTLVYELGDPAKPIFAIDSLKDMGRSASSLVVVAWAGSIAATLAALEAQAAPQGGGVVAPSIACVKWWTQPVGPLTADIRGEIGAGYDNRVAHIAERLISARSTLLLSNLGAAYGWRTGPAGLHVDDSSETVAQALDRLLRGSSLAWAANADGTIRISEFSFAAPVETVSAIDVARVEAFKPTRSRRVGFLRNHRIHGEGEISAALRDDAGAILTAGADWTSSVANRPANLAALGGSEGVNNAAVSISPGGALANAGGGQVTITGLGYSGELNATFGAAWASTLTGRPTNLSGLAGGEGILNASISISPSGALSNAGGGQVTITGLGFTGELTATFGARTGSTLLDSGGSVLTDSGATGVRNTAISIASNGSLSGAAGGQVTIAGLGFTGELNATNGAQVGTTMRFAGGAVISSDALIYNLSITITGNALNGIGTGAGTLVANLGVSISASGALTGAGGGQVTPTGLGLEDGADVTSFIEGAKLLEVQFDSSLVAKAGQLPKEAQYQLLRAGVVITSGATWSVSPIEGSGTATISAGAFSASALPANTRFRIAAEYLGRTRYFDVTVNRKVDAAPSQGQNGGSATSAGLSGDIASGTLVPLSAEFAIKPGSNGQVVLSAEYEFSATGNSGSMSVSTRWYRDTGAGYVAIGTSGPSDSPAQPEGTGSGGIVFTDTGLSPSSLPKYKLYASRTVEGTASISGIVNLVGL